MRCAKFVSFAGAAGPDVAGVLVDDQTVADLSHPSCAALLAGAAANMLALVAAPGSLTALAARCRAHRFDPAALRPLGSLQLRAPLRPGKVVGAAFNFTDALAERGMAPPGEPVTFVRSGCTVIGPGEAIEVPPDVGNVGYEAELAVVIGRRALNVSEADAMAFVAGYTAHNDVSGSALVKQDGNFVRGKNLPASAPLGPWLLSADALPNPHAVGIRFDIDGRLLQNGSTASMLFRIPALIAHISARMPLEPGDVIATGTPAGIAASHTPAAWLAPGQTVHVRVEGFGVLSNPVVAGPNFL